MNWGSWDNFLRMGGYGFFVWGSYGMAMAVIAIEVWQLRVKRRRAVTELRREAARRST